MAEPSCNKEALHRQALIEFGRGELAKSEALVIQAIGLDALSPALYNTLGSIYLAQKKIMEAGDMLAEALRLRPNFAEAKYNSGLVSQQQGELLQAAAWFEEAIAIKPAYPECWNNLGLLHKQQGQYQKAVDCFQRAITLRPEFWQAKFNLGGVWLELENSHEAFQSFWQVISFVPDLAEKIYYKGTFYQQEKQYGLAHACYETVLLLKPDWPECLNNLGSLWLLKGEPGLAAPYIERAMAIQPRHAEAHFNAGCIAQALQNKKLAFSFYKKALVLKPNFAEAYNNMGNLYHRMGALASAKRCYETAMYYQPQLLSAGNNLATYLQNEGQVEKAIQLYRQSLHNDPDHEVTKANLALALLLMGNYQEGWPLYEYRWYQDGLQGTQPHFEQPKWQGENIGAKTLLLYAEQGYGDNIQFIRYLPWVRSQLPKARIIFWSLQPLMALFSFLAQQCHVELLAREETPAHFDYQLSLISVARIANTTLATVPARVPYLQVAEQTKSKWQKKINQIPRPRVGIVWSGDPKANYDWMRSIHLKYLLPLLEVKNIYFVNLQKGEAARQLFLLDPTIRIANWMPEVENFADTAAIIDELQLVIGVDTSVIHLAAAMGKPVWLCNRLNSDWRWLRQGPTTPWYPMVHIFRQQQKGKWDEVIATLTQQLGQWQQQQG